MFDFNSFTFAVICRDDWNDGVRGPYTLATRQLFATRELALAYAATVNESREPLVVEGRFFSLRHPRVPERDRPPPGRKPVTEQEFNPDDSGRT